MTTNREPTTLGEHMEGVPASCREVVRILRRNHLPYRLEWEFDKKEGGTRKWRHDVFIPCLSMGHNRGIAIEVEGGMAQEGQWSRHNTVMGFEKDLEKYSASMALGNYVYRTSTKVGVIRKVLEKVVEHYRRMEGEYKPVF